MVSVLITGGSGFIGRHLVKRLENKEDCAITVAGRRPDPDGHGVTWVEADLSRSGWTKNLQQKQDVIIHLAQSRHYREFPQAARDVVHVNITSTFELLEWSLRHQVKRFFLASSGNVYKPSRKLLNETDKCSPSDFYGASKLSAECLTASYSRFFEITILRFFGVYGPGQADTILPRIVEMVRTGQRITLAKGKGLCFSPLYVSDCIEILSRLIEGRRQSPKEIYNIAGSHVASLGDAVSIVEQLIGVRANVQVTKEAPRYLKGDASKVFAATGHLPVVNLSEGIARMLER